MFLLLPAVLARPGLLHPQTSESRETQSLDGIWKLRFDSEAKGLQEQWPLVGIGDAAIPMPVPSSYNDIVQDAALREHVGLVWYEREAFLPNSWRSQRVVLYVGSANHLAQVWLNGRFVGQHEGGHLPFHLPLDPSVLKFSGRNRVTIALNNTLTATTIPPGFTQKNIAGRTIQRLQMDFFNYAGLHRSVLFYTTPSQYLDDILVSCQLEGSTAYLNVFISAISQRAATKAGAEALAAAGAGAASSTAAVPTSGPILVTLLDAKGAVVARGRMPNDPRRGGRLQVPNARLWWPRYMSDTPGYLYTLLIEIRPDAQGAEAGNVTDAITDVYRLRYGIRTVEATSDRGFLINRVPFYFYGFGKHEDSELRGRALDLPQLVKDANLMSWIGANSLRTTHYPYSDEFLFLCDELGIVVIGEAPAVGLQAVNFVRETLGTHLNVMREMITRDKNHPSIVLWSVANEPDSEAPGAAAYFEHLIAQTRQLDPSRPVTAASFKSLDRDATAPLVDVLMLNRYHGWYSNSGQLDVIVPSLVRDVTSWHAKYKKPILVSEYGCDAVAGLHSDPPITFSEEYQSAYLREHFDAFDELKRKGGDRVLIGEHVGHAHFRMPSPRDPTPPLSSPSFSLCPDV